jgi:ceramide glucosyltransferase
MWMRTIRLLRPGSFPFLFISCSLPLAFIGFALSFTQASFHQVSPVLLIVSIYARFILHRLSKAAGDPGGRGGLWFLPLIDLLVFWVWCRVFFTSSVIRMSHELAESR